MIRAATPIACLGALLMLPASPAHAELTLCNRTSYLMDAAIGLAKAANVTTRGWFRLAPGTMPPSAGRPARCRFHLFARPHAAGLRQRAFARQRRHRVVRARGRFHACRCARLSAGRASPFRRGAPVRFRQGPDRQSRRGSRLRRRAGAARRHPAAVGDRGLRRHPDRRRRRRQDAGRARQVPAGPQAGRPPRRTTRRSSTRCCRRRPVRRTKASPGATTAPTR